MKRLSILFTLLLLFVSAQAHTPSHDHHNHAHTHTPDKPTDAHLYGHVTDKTTGEHMAYINVRIECTTIGVMTDATGHYFIKNIPQGTYTVVATSLGYASFEREVTLYPGESQELNFSILPEHFSLDEVVVTSNRNVTTRRMAPSLVKVLDVSTLSKVNAACIAEGLNFQPGVRVEDNCQNCGFQQVRINGLDGHYSQILIDSRPIFSALSGVYGLEQIPANMIERVEVVRGGGSALFGSSAVGGTVNIITREPLHNSASASHTSTNFSGSNAWDNNTMLNASLVTDNGKAGVYIYGQHRQRDAYDHDGDGFTELPKLRGITIGTRAYYKTSLYSKLTFEYHGINEKRRGGDNLHLPPHEAMIAEQTEHSINGGGINFDYFTPDYKNKLNVFVSLQNTNRDSYYGAGQDLSAYGFTHDLTTVAGAQYMHSFDKFLFMPAEMTAGIEYNYDALSDDAPGYDRYIDQKVHIGSAYFQNEWKNERWGFLIGARLDKHNLVKNLIFSPRVNLRYNPTKDINIRLSYSEGFRAPQAFDEDLHIMAVGGEVSLIVLDPNLKEERSRSVSASVDIYENIGSVPTNFLLEGFFTNLSDAFVMEHIGSDAAGNAIIQRRNGGGGQVFGVNFEGRAAVSSWLEAQLGLTWQRSLYKTPEVWSEDPDAEAAHEMFRTPDWYGFLTCTFKPTHHLAIDLSGTYTGEMWVQHLAGYIEKDRLERTPDFFNANVKVAYDFDLSSELTLQLHAGVQNIFNAYQKDFDKGPNRDSGYIYGPSTPRSYFFGVKFDFR
ncbi:MAG: TonB-dependent receptor [Muribaculaceae bacterium]|nr:TonB-dependent receptor [Muribaculaceae bacterium]